MRHGIRTLIAIAAVAILGLPSAVEAQGTLIRTGNGSGLTVGTNRGTVYTSPYQGRFAGDPTNAQIDLFCIDFMHNASPLNLGYSVQQTSLGGGSIAGTRFAGVTNSLARYQQAAWLISHHSTATDAQWRSIQVAIWKIFTPTAYATNSGVEAAANNWLNAARAGYDDGDISYANYVVLTGQGAGGNYQEFVMVTPEPETYALMLTGLLALFVVWRRRRQSGGDETLHLGGLGV